MSKLKNKTTKICGHDDGQINIRGFSLTDELIGKISFTEMLLLHFLGVKPSHKQIAILDSVLVAIMEHGITPSVISARQTLLGAPESFQGAVSAGLLGIGDHFAGTCSKCASLLDEAVELDIEINSASEVVISKFHDAGGKYVPGFGHPSFKTSDPRTVKLFEIARSVGVAGRYIETVNIFAKIIEKKQNKLLVPNVSAAIAAVLLECEIPIAVMRGIVLVARCGGLIGHVLEEIENPIANEIWQNADQTTYYKT